MQRFRGDPVGQSEQGVAPNALYPAQYRRAQLSRLGNRIVSSIVALSIFWSSVAGPLAPAYAQAIVDPKAPIKFRPGITASDNGTPTVNIVRPGQGGVSHNKFRQYNIDTRGLILNNSGLGGASVIGGKVAPNPNLSTGSEAKIIVNEVTGAKRSFLNGVTEVFGRKADVIVANPNGVSCASCAFINTGTATLTSGKPIVDRSAGRVHLMTRRGDVTISGAGVGAPDGYSLGGINLVGRKVKLNGVVEAAGAVDIVAGATRHDLASGNIKALAETKGIASRAIVSTAAGRIQAASIAILSFDLNTGIALSGSVQALGSLNSAGQLVPGDLRIVSAGDLSLVSGESSGDASFRVGHQWTLARDLVAAGNIAITATDVSLLLAAGVHAGQDLSVVTSGDIASAAVLKAGGALSARAGGDATFSGLIASHDDVDLAAGGMLATNNATLVAPTVSLGADRIDLEKTWVVPEQSGSISAADVTLGEGTAFNPSVPVAVVTTGLTLGTLIDDKAYPALSLVYSDLALTSTGGLIRDILDLSGLGHVSNQGTLIGRKGVTIAAGELSNQASGIIYSGDAIDIALSGTLTNLGSILSSSTLNVLTDGAVLNNGEIAAAGDLKLEAISYGAGTATARLTALNADLILHRGLTNAGLIAAATNLGIKAASLINKAGGTIQAGNTVTDEVGKVHTIAGLIEANIAGDLTNLGRIFSTDTMNSLVGGLVTNAGTVSAGNDLQLSAHDLVNDAGDAASPAIIGAANGVTITTTGKLDNLNGSLLAQNGALTIGGAGTTLTNRGLISAAGAVNIDVATLANDATLARVEGTAITVKLTGNLANLGTILSIGDTNLTAGGAIANDGTISAAQDADAQRRILCRQFSFGTARSAEGRSDPVRRSFQCRRDRHCRQSRHQGCLVDQ